MSDKSWKAVERKVAKTLGTERTPLSGGNSKQTRSDSLHDKIYLETKQRAHFSVLSLYRETLSKARKENKVCVLCLKEKGKHGELAVIDWGLFVEMWRRYTE
uniref:Uncharacterized protein n=1 Tax=viral metagenome TaxID=1070528 RepID=A0A6M3JIX9_9ZZZZ